MKNIIFLATVLIGLNASAQWVKTKSINKGEVRHGYVSNKDTLAFKTYNLYTKETVVYSEIDEEAKICLDNQPYGKYFTYKTDGLKDDYYYNMIILFSDQTTINLNDSISMVNDRLSILTHELKPDQVLALKTKTISGIMVGGIVEEIKNTERIKKTANIIWETL